MTRVGVVLIAHVARRAGRIGTGRRGEDEGNEKQHYEGTDPA